MVNIVWFSHTTSLAIARNRTRMKTTLNLNDLLLTRAKRCAARSGVTLTRFVEDALRARLAEDDRPKPPFELTLVTVRGLAPPSVDISDREELHDVMDGT